MKSLREICLNFVIDNKIDFSPLIEDLLNDLFFLQHNRLYARILIEFVRMVVPFDPKKHKDMQITKMHWLVTEKRICITKEGWRWVER